MKIVQLTAENVKKLKAIDITPMKDFIQVTGKNGSGKTSVLDCICWALAGKDAIQGQPIRKGEEKATIKLDLGDIQVIRRFTASGTTLVVESKDGARYPSPQAMLDALIGHMTFDPLEFSRKDAKKQFDELKVLADVKIDLMAFAAAETIDKEKRAEIKRDVKTLEAQMAGIMVPPDAPDEEVSISDLMHALNNLENTNALLREEEIVYDNAVATRTKLATEIAHAEVHLNNLKSALAGIDAKISTFTPIEYKSTDDIKAQISGAQAKNNAYAAKVRRGETNATIALKNGEVEKLTQKINDRIAEKNKALQESKMPIDGLTFGENQILFNDIPFDQLSAAEQLRVSVAIAMAANPKLKVIRIKDGSLLDDDSLKIVQEMTADREFQVWCETVNTTGKVGIVMEDGEIKAMNEDAA